MTDINFYVSPQEGLDHRLIIAHRLVKLALKHNLTIFINTENEETSKQVDKLLWTKEKHSFIPHGIISNNNSLENNNLETANKVFISHNYEPMNDCDYLINLTNQRPAFFSRFKKVAEILDNTDEILSAGRKRYAFYRDRGYTLAYHQM